MLSNTLLALLATSASALAASNSVAVYWGQNGAGGQDRLSTYCADSNVDVVILSFLNDFPDPTNVNFANQCGATYPSGLLHCSAIGEDIKTCQASGKKVLLSLGGAAGNYGFKTTDDAVAYADTLWNKFGNGKDDEERPFDDAVVDGFDFDIELGTSTGYPELATALKSKFDSSKKYYLSASPQCVYPDAHVGPLLEKVPLDFAFIQFYNNPCSVDGQFNYVTWSKFASSSPNPDLKLYVGVPSTGNVAGYVDAATLAKSIDEIKCDKHFAGVSLWDASGAWLNTDASGANFADQVKKVLDDNTCPAPSSSSTTASPSTTTNNNKDIVDPTSAVVSPSGGYQNTTITKDPVVSTATNIHTTIITVTSCDDHKCSEVPVTTGVLTVSEVDTVYTTYCPLPTTSAKPTTSVKAPASTVTNIETAIVTITSCEDNKCTEVPVTTGVVTITDVDTVYTTYCPLPTTTAAASKPAPVAPVESSTAPAPVAPVESSTAPAPVAPVESSTAPAPTVAAPSVEAETLTTTYDLTSTVAPEQQAPASSSAAAPEIISTYEGAAASNNAMWFSVPLVFIAALL